MPLRWSGITHGLSESQNRVLGSKWFGLNCHSLNEQFDVPRDFEKNSILSWFCTLDKKTTLLNWIFNGTCLLVLVYIGQKLYFKTISAEFTAKTARYSEPHWQQKMLVSPSSTMLQYSWYDHCNLCHSLISEVGKLIAGQIRITGRAEVSVVYPWSYCDSGRVYWHLWDRGSLFQPQLTQCPAAHNSPP